MRHDDGALRRSPAPRGAPPSVFPQRWMPDEPKCQASKDWEALDAQLETDVLATTALTHALACEFQKDHPENRVRKRARSAAWEQEICASRPEDTYRGPHLTFPLTPDQVDALGLHFATCQHEPLHAAYQGRLIVEARDLFARGPRVQRISIRSKQHKRLIVVGDLHGQLADLLTIFNENGFPSPEGTQYLFNGDFVDRGEKGTEVVTLLLAYKLVYPDSVHLNRGNHETVAMNMAYGFADEVILSLRSGAHVPVLQPAHVIAQSTGAVEEEGSKTFGLPLDRILSAVMPPFLLVLSSPWPGQIPRNKQPNLSGTFIMCQHRGFWRFLGSFASFASICGSKDTPPPILRVGNSKKAGFGLYVDG